MGLTRSRISGGPPRNPRGLSVYDGPFRGTGPDGRITMTIGIRREDGAARQRLRRHVGAAAVAALALLTAACTGSGHGTSQVSPAANATPGATASRAAVAVPELKI